MRVPEATKRILTDETGQDIVSALQALTNVVDPNGTTIAAAAKLNNMTTSIVPLAAGQSPNSTLTVVDGHFHLTLYVPVELPVVTSQNNGQIMKVENGAWTAGDAPTDVPAVTASDNGKILQVNNGAWSAENSLPTVMTGATLQAAGTSGLVPAPNETEVDKFLSGDGTYKSGGLPMVILKYGISTWADFEAAYRNNVIVYCRASSGSNPASGAQTRMAFMAYVNDETTPTEVEFQYYRSVSTHKNTQMGDEVYVYKLNKNTGWSVTKRLASLQQIVCTATGLTTTYNTTTNVLTIADAT